MVARLLVFRPSLSQCRPHRRRLLILRTEQPLHPRRLSHPHCPLPSHLHRLPLFRLLPTHRLIPHWSRHPPPLRTGTIINMYNSPHECRRRRHRTRRATTLRLRRLHHLPPPPRTFHLRLHHLWRRGRRHATRAKLPPRARKRSRSTKRRPRRRTCGIRPAHLPGRNRPAPTKRVRYGNLRGRSARLRRQGERQSVVTRSLRVSWTEY